MGQRVAKFVLRAGGRLEFARAPRDCAGAFPEPGQARQHGIEDQTLRCAGGRLSRPLDFLEHSGDGRGRVGDGAAETHSELRQASRRGGRPLRLRIHAFDGFRQALGVPFELAEARGSRLDIRSQQAGRRGIGWLIGGAIGLGPLGYGRIGRKRRKRGKSRAEICQGSMIGLCGNRLAVEPGTVSQAEPQQRTAEEGDAADDEDTVDAGALHGDRAAKRHARDRHQTRKPKTAFDRIVKALQNAHGSGSCLDEIAGLRGSILHVKGLWLLNRITLGFVLAAALSVPPARAGDTGSFSAQYEGFSHGLLVLRLAGQLTLTPATYVGALQYHLAGMIGWMIRNEDQSQATGVFDGNSAVPKRFDSVGNLRGTERITRIHYSGGDPVIEVRTPPVQLERTEVPAGMTPHTIDTLSAIALLIHQASATGTCNGNATLYDGRRLTALTARTVGDEMLPKTGRSIFSGQALRCDFDGNQLAGFKKDEPEAEQRKTKHGVAWLAQAIPGGPLVPVKVIFENKILGQVTLYLTALTGGSGPIARANR